jgi:hypothetical protein
MSFLAYSTPDTSLQYNTNVLNELIANDKCQIAEDRFLLHPLRTGIPGPRLAVYHLSYIMRNADVRLLTSSYVPDA